MMSNGILSMADKNILTQGMSHQKRVTTHWVLQSIAMVMVTIGQSAIYVNKELNGWPHFTSTHSLFGLATFMLAFGATLGGTLTKYSFQLRSFVKPAMLKVGHGFAGITVYVMAVATIFLGLNQSWTDFGDMQLKFAILGAFIVTTIYVISKSFKVTLSRARGLSKK
jgi:cytochrome b-561 domain containing protein 2